MTSPIEIDAGEDAATPPAERDVIDAGLQVLAGRTGHLPEDLQQLLDYTKGLKEADDRLPFHAPPTNESPLELTEQEEVQRIRALLDSAAEGREPPVEALEPAPAPEPAPELAPEAKAEEVAPAAQEPQIEHQLLAKVVDILAQQREREAREEREREALKQAEAADPRRLAEQMRALRLDPENERDVLLYQVGLENQRLRAEHESALREMREHSQRLAYMERRAATERDLDTHLAAYDGVPAETRAVIAEQAASLIHAGHEPAKAFDAAMRAVRPLLDAKFRKGTSPKKTVPATPAPRSIDNQTRRQLDAAAVKGPGAGKRQTPVSTKELLDRAMSLLR